MYLEPHELCLWVGFAFVGIGYALAAFKAFEENTMWGWWVVIFPPLNMWYAYVMLIVDRKAFFAYAAGISLWVIGYLVYLASGTAHAAPWHGFELAA